MSQRKSIGVLEKPVQPRHPQGFVCVWNSNLSVNDNTERGQNRYITTWPLLTKYFKYYKYIDF